MTDITETLREVIEEYLQYLRALTNSMSKLKQRHDELRNRHQTLNEHWNEVNSSVETMQLEFVNRSREITSESAIIFQLEMSYFNQRRELVEKIASEEKTNVQALLPLYSDLRDLTFQNLDEGIPVLKQLSERYEELIIQLEDFVASQNSE
jgi:predicted  nucleic acid-binding Zn-ribbon protein